MKKRFGVVTIVLLFVAFANFPVLLHGWDLQRPQYFPEGAVKGTIRLWDVDWQFVGVKYERDLWSAGAAAWRVGPSDVIEIIHPDPNVNPAIVRWMKQNNVDWAITYFVNEYGDLDSFWVTRANGDDTYSTLYYNGGR